MAIIRDKQGKLIVNGKVIPRHLEQLYLRRGVTEDKAEFPVKTEIDKIQDMERPYDVNIHMAGGEVKHYDKPNKNDKVQKTEHMSYNKISKSIDIPESTYDDHAKATLINDEYFQYNEQTKSIKIS